MSQSLDLLSDTADRLFSALADRRDEGFADLWPDVVAAGFPDLLRPEAGGGFGGDWPDAFAVARMAGFYALHLPVADAIVGGHLAEPGDGLAVLTEKCAGKLVGARFTGRLAGAAWGRHTQTLLATLDGELIKLRTSDASHSVERENAAGEPRDVFIFEAAAAEVLPIVQEPLVLAALVRTAQIAGALDAALALSITYANQRSQFGKPIGKFQAVQQSLAVFAEEAGAVNCAGQAGARALDGAEAGFEVGIAKLRANMAAGVGAATAHQVHGAIGFTQEFGLHHLTRRLVAWRAEFGADRYWAERIGRQAAGFGPEGFWPELTRRSDAA